MRAWDAAASTPWTIREDALRTILSVASRENLTPEAVEAALGRPLENTRAVTVRDGVATIPVMGPLFRYANLFSRISGGTSIEELATDFTTALEDPQVRAILFYFDTPGGEALGISELAQLIAGARGQKPMTAFVTGMAASGGYWLASAADEVVVSDIAMVGSIGAVWVLRTKDDPSAVEIVSTQSPKKRLDPATEAGRSELQRLADELAAVFIASVAENRGVSEETVLSDFGQGGLLLGAAAVTAGMADRVSTYEAVLAELAARTAPGARGMPAGGGFRPTSHRGTTMADTNATPAADQQPATITAESLAANHPHIAEHFRAEGRAAGAEAERARILGIEELAVEGHEALIAECKRDASCTPEAAAMKVLKAQRAAAATSEAKRKGHLDALAGDEEQLDKPNPGTGAGNSAEPSTEEKQAGEMLGVISMFRRTKDAKQTAAR